ncbi:papain-like cysteine protease family protein [Rhodanobacter sp. Col0626]|uniref:papain-like cysteine protease family protein n=1 Tax=Rhodanobacter sp. Col0626 TaxID=3415679 RepID=UPI003CF7E119
MKIMQRLATAIGLGVLSSAAVAGAGYSSLDVTQVIQEHSNWCWAASSVDILKWYKLNPSQCGVVNWAFGRADACGSGVFDWNSAANSPNSLYGDNGSVQAILGNNGVRSTPSASALTWNTIVNEVNAGHPFVMRFGWYGGGGHILVGYGYDDRNGTMMVAYMNPWPGEGYTWSTYAWTKSAAYDHTWTHSLRTTK